MIRIEKNSDNEIKEYMNKLGISNSSALQQLDKKKAE
jgi:hypothetical protein